MCWSRHWAVKKHKEHSLKNRQKWHSIDTCLNTFKLTAFSHLEHRSNMTEYSFYTRPSPERDQWCPTPYLKFVTPHFMFGSPVVAYIQSCIYKMCPPCGFCPPSAKSWQRAWFYNCIRYRNAKTRQSICSELSVRMPVVLPMQKNNIAIEQWWSLDTWSRPQESSRGPILRVSVSTLSCLVSVSKATGLGNKPIVLRLWILQGYGLVGKTVIQRVFSLLHLQVRNNENRSE